MSDERQSGSVAFLSERLHYSTRPFGSLKRKLGQTVPISRQRLATYPSPPMSNPPSPSRPSSQTSPISSVEQQTTTTATSWPQPSNIQQTLAPSASTVEQTAAPPPFDFATGARSNQAPLSGDALHSSGSFGSFAGGQNVFPVGSDTVTGPATSPAAVTMRTGKKAKAHVASACMNCKRAHLSCDIQRPCTRCITSGKQVSSDRCTSQARGRLTP